MFLLFPGVSVRAASDAGGTSGTTAFWLFLAGNTLYYLVGIVFAFLFQDNRAFCKYLCPITVFLKPMSYFSSARPLR